MQSIRCGLLLRMFRGLFVCVSLLFTVMSPTKTDQPIEVPFRIFAQMDPKNRVLDRWEPGLLPKKETAFVFFSGGGPSHPI